ncbi:MAG: LysR family transcriptional regulator [Treponema sp.]|jgi:LysR family cyn operon transcriptional activator|nr:LysR family transcriptional regulator [Treponema sp.]
MMNIQQIRQFIVIAKAGSILKASEQLFITHQALGRSLHNLEDELGAPLLTKSGSGVQLTELGYKILPVAESMLAKYGEHENLIRSLSGQTGGFITISLEHDLLKLALPAELISYYDVMKTKFKNSGNIEKCAAEVMRGKADLGICVGGNDYDGLEFIPFFTESIAVIMRKDHYLAKKRKLRLLDLRGVSMIGLDIRDKTTSAYIDACIKEGFYPNFVLESSNLELIMRTVIAQNAILPLASFAISDFLLDRLVIRPLIHDDLKVVVGFLVRGDVKQKPLVESYINAVCKYYSR